MTFMLRSTLACRWEQFLFRPLIIRLIAEGSLTPALIDDLFKRMTGQGRGAAAAT
jgi:hypothetical protein